MLPLVIFCLISYHIVAELALILYIMIINSQNDGIELFTFTTGDELHYILSTHPLLYVRSFSHMKETPLELVEWNMCQ